MTLIDVRDLTRTFVVRKRAEPAHPHPERGAGGPRPDLQRRGRRDGGLHRPERGREVDHDQDADRHPGADLGPPPGRRPRAQPGAHRAGPPDRRRLRTADDAVVGPPAAGQLRAAAEDLPGGAGAAPPQPRGVRRAARPRRPARHPGAPAQPGSADARGHHGRTAARPRDPVPRRAHHRSGRGQQGAAARVPAHPQRRAGHDPDADHPRPAGHRGAVRPGDRDRPRDGGLRRAARGPAPTRRVASHPGGRPGGRGSTDRGRRCGDPQGRRAAAVAELPRGCRAPPRSSPRWPRRTPSPTCRSRNRTSRP